MLPVSNTINWHVHSFSKLGQEIRISPKARVAINHPGFKIQYDVETVSLLIGIGNNQTAHLVMSLAAWEALKAGELQSIETLQEFKAKLK